MGVFVFVQAADIVDPDLELVGAGPVVARVDLNLVGPVVGVQEAPDDVLGLVSVVSVTVLGPLGGDLGVPDGRDVGVGEREVRMFFDAEHVLPDSANGLDHVGAVGVEPDSVELALAGLGDLAGEVHDDDGVLEVSQCVAYRRVRDGAGEGELVGCCLG